jgi:hypothetical protein
LVFGPEPRRTPCSAPPPPRLAVAENLDATLFGAASTGSGKTHTPTERIATTTLRPDGSIPLSCGTCQGIEANGS